MSTERSLTLHVIALHLSVYCKNKLVKDIAKFDRLYRHIYYGSRAHEQNLCRVPGDHWGLTLVTPLGTDLLWQTAYNKNPENWFCKAFGAPKTRLVDIVHISSIILLPAFAVKFELNLLVGHEVYAPVSNRLDSRREKRNGAYFIHLFPRLKRYMSKRFREIRSLFH